MNDTAKCCAGAVTRLPNNQSVSTTRTDSSGDAPHAVLQPVSSSKESAPTPQTGSAAVSSTPSQSAGMAHTLWVLCTMHAVCTACLLVARQPMGSAKEAAPTPQAAQRSAGPPPSLQVWGWLSVSATCKLCDRCQLLHHQSCALKLKTGGEPHLCWLQLHLSSPKA